MNPPKCSDDDYINFVIASLRSVSATEAAKVQGDEELALAHDAFTRLLHRLEPDAATGSYCQLLVNVTTPRETSIVNWQGLS